MRLAVEMRQLGRVVSRACREVRRHGRLDAREVGGV